MTWILLHWQELAATLYLLINEVIAQNPNWKANSIVQVLLGILKTFIPRSGEPVVKE